MTDSLTFMRRRRLQEMDRIEKLTPSEAACEYSYHAANYNPKNRDDLQMLLAVSQQDARYRKALTCPFATLMVVKS